MKLAQLFVKDAMDLTLSTPDNASTLRILAEQFAKEGGESDVARYGEKLDTREDNCTMGVGDAIANQHAQGDEITQTAIVLSR